jgi:MFS transporter, FSR family, fosmidomycin resistance protein
MARRPRAVLGTAAATHFVHDGFSDIIYVLLPLWAGEFRLSFAQVGLIRTAYSGGMAAFQIPAGFLAERWGERRLLAAGTVLTAAGFIAVGWVGGFVSLLAILLAAGLGSGVQHPLSSSLVSKAYETGARRVALGTYNFSGDLGKVAVPAAVALVATWIGWRAAAQSYGLVGLAAAVVILAVLARLGAGEGPAAPAVTTASWGSSWGIRNARGFKALAAIGVIDNGTRSAFLTFLPFLLLGKGSSVAGIGLALGLVFAGGAVGKFVCGAISERVGVIRTVVLTEAATTLGILVALVAPLGVTFVLLPGLGVALNGTSSVLYGTVADLVTPDRRSRAYGLFYTLGVGASSLAPSVYGVLSDHVGVPTTITVIGLVVLITVPLCLVLREPLSGLALAETPDGHGHAK